MISLVSCLLMFFQVNHLVVQHHNLHVNRVYNQQDNQSWYQQVNLHVNRHVNLQVNPVENQRCNPPVNHLVVHPHNLRDNHRVNQPRSRYPFHQVTFNIHTHLTHVLFKPRSFYHHFPPITFLLILMLNRILPHFVHYYRSTLTSTIVTTYHGAFKSAIESTHTTSFGSTNSATFKIAI